MWSIGNTNGTGNGKGLNLCATQFWRWRKGKSPCFEVSCFGKNMLPILSVCGGTALLRWISATKNLIDCSIYFWAKIFLTPENQKLNEKRLLYVI